jgi:choline-sulfatase
MDSIADQGVKFSNAYTTCPLCLPARAAMWTGTLPHDTWSVSNQRKFKNGHVSENMPSLGSLFREAGYDTVHFGKTHDNGALHGFECVDEREMDVEECEAWPVDYDSKRDEYTVLKSVEFLSRKHEVPFVAIVDLNNPHDICNWIGKFAGEHEDVTGPGPLPELPDNFGIEDLENRPLPVQYICCSHNRLSQAAKWTESNYRHYLAAYYHYVKRADDSVARVMDALKNSDVADNTLIVLVADHGDGMTAHHMVTKQVSFIEETVGVPMMFAGPGIAGNGREVKSLVSLSDIMPTLCEYAGINPPKGIYGRSLMPQLRGEEDRHEREFVASEWMTEWGITIEPGRMIRTRDFKYTRFIEGDGEELYDMLNDPGETLNLANRARYRGVLEYHRQLLDKHVREQSDPFWALAWHADSRWRAHPAGYHHHEGPAAPMTEK